MAGQGQGNGEPPPNEGLELQLEYWPEPAHFDLETMNHSLDWLAPLDQVPAAHHHAAAAAAAGGGTTTAAAAAAALQSALPLLGPISRSDAAAYSQLAQQQALHSQLQSLHPMLSGGHDGVSAVLAPLLLLSSSPLRCFMLLRYLYRCVLRLILNVN